MDAFMLILRIWLWTEVVLATVIRNLDEHPCRTYVLDGRKHLDCSDKGLLDLPDGFDYDVKVLLLTNNNFASFPTILGNLNAVEVLDISDNHLNSPLPTYMQSWTCFETLNLSNNNYENWAYSGPSLNINRLDLSRNKLNSVEEDSFSGLPKLTFLDLSENRIYDLSPGTFSRTGLEDLNLSRNYLSSIPNFRLPSLKRLFLSNCQVIKINQDALLGMDSLLAIDLSMNQIEYLPDNLQSDNLEELNLSYNWITKITDRTFSSLPHLAVLDMRGNEFKEVWSPSYFSSNPFLREVYLKGNRWSCEGFIVNLLLSYEYLTKTPSKVLDKSSLICFSPSNVTQLNWQDAYIKTWHGNADSPQTYYVMAAIIGIVIGIVVTSIVCRCLMSMNRLPPVQAQASESVSLNANGLTAIPRVESVELRIPLGEDLPPTYDEALLMPRLNASFHSLPDFIDEEEEQVIDNRRSRSIGDLTEPRPRQNNRRSIRRTLEIRINSIE